MSNCQTVLAIADKITGLFTSGRNVDDKEEKNEAISKEDQIRYEKMDSNAEDFQPNSKENMTLNAVIFCLLIKK